MTYEFADEAVWPLSSLQERQPLLGIQTDFEHTEPRKSEITRELAHLMVELECREKEHESART